jgi:hypothetical protein
MLLIGIFMHQIIQLYRLIMLEILIYYLTLMLKATYMLIMYRLIPSIPGTELTQLVHWQNQQLELSVIMEPQQYRLME